MASGAATEHTARRPSFLARLILALLVVAVAVDLGMARFGYLSGSLYLWLRTSPFNRVHRGMTKSQVIAIVGQPASREPNSGYLTWIYYGGQAAQGAGVRTVTCGVILTVFFGPDRRLSEYFPGPKGDVAKGLTRGMTEQEVVKHVGKAGDVRKSSFAERWVYPHWNDDIRHEVLFDDSGRVVWVSEHYSLISWPGQSRSEGRAHD